MVKRLFFFLLFSVVLAVGCNDQLGESFDQSGEFITFGTSSFCGLETKASEVNAMESFNVTAVTGGAGSEVSVFNNETFLRKAGSSPALYSSSKVWPSVDQGYKFYASNVSMTFGAGGTTVAATTETDVVVAYLADGTYKARNTLSFNHIFARVGTVNVIADDNYEISDITVWIRNLKTGGTYNIRTGVGQTDGTGWSSLSPSVPSDTQVYRYAGAVAPGGSRSSSGDFWMVPGEYSVVSTWTAHVNDYTQTYTQKAVKVVIPSGQVNKLDVVLTGNEIRVAVLAEDLIGWGTGVSAERARWGSDVSVGDEIEWSRDYGFTVNAQGDMVIFAPGNLQAHIASGPDANSVYTADAWKFAERQYDYCNTTLAVGNWHDMFGWVGASASYDSYGLSTITSNNNAIYGTDGSDALKTDWGEIPGVVSSLGAGWRTLTSAEYVYLLNSRATGATVNGTFNARFTEATVNTDGTPVNGVILFPDGYAGGTPSGVTWGMVNYDIYSGIYPPSDWGTKCTVAGWKALEAAGCVFLPAAGVRDGSGMESVGSLGVYWSCSVRSVDYAYCVLIDRYGVNVQFNDSRKVGFSVRLVKDF